MFLITQLHLWIITIADIFKYKTIYTSFLCHRTNRIIYTWKINLLRENKKNIFILIHSTQQDFV